MSVFKHFILTRFNVPWMTINDDAPGSVWLRHRFDLFDRFCYPSLKGQTNQNFTWLVFFDAGTPRVYWKYIDDYAKWEKFNAVFIEGYSLTRVKKEIDKHLGDSNFVITTRIDNDDAICRRFVETVQHNFNEQTFELINFPNGFVWHEGRTYRSRQMSNPFMSLIESAQMYETVWCRSHLELRELAEIKQIESPPAWLQVIHEMNVCNEVQGVLQPRLNLSSTFAIHKASTRRPMGSKPKRASKT